MALASRGAALSLLATLALPCAARGQVVSGLVAEQLSLAPAVGAVVVLLRVTEADGLEPVGVATTDESGAFSLTVPSEGVFRVQATMGGLASPLSPGMAFTTGSADVTDVAYARELIETRKVAAIPPSVFYARPPGALPWLRFAFCKRDETLTRAAALLA